MSQNPQIAPVELAAFPRLLNGLGKGANGCGKERGTGEKGRRERKRKGKGICYGLKPPKQKNPGYVPAEAESEAGMLYTSLKELYAKTCTRTKKFDFQDLTSLIVRSLI